MDRGESRGREPGGPSDDGIASASLPVTVTTTVGIATGDGTTVSEALAASMTRMGP